jgi:hypothetical protein
VFYCICDCLSLSGPTTVAIGLSNCNCVIRKFKISTFKKNVYLILCWTLNVYVIPYLYINVFRV